MLTYYDSQNNSIKLIKELGRGGEGTVYSCADETLVGKIYHEPIADEKAEKLLWMAENSTAQLLKTTAWVAQVLREKPDGRIVGFLMPKIRAKEIHELYAPKSRRVHFPDATWHFLIHTATNLARAFHNLHKDGHVMGDVNQGNCVVTADGTVKLIDCDSYGIKTADKAYPCEVGVTTHIAPELQGKNLRNVTRTENHDNFGLAVIIFQLLFLGRHPFAGNYLGAEDKTLEDAIRQHLFVYGKDAEKKKVVRPPGTLPLAAVSPQVAQLFENAFSWTNVRPKPREWIEGLEYLAENLQQCLLNPGHVFYSKFTSEFSLCPWCEIEGNTGLMLFPFSVSMNALDKKYVRDFDAETVEKLIESFKVSSLPTKLSDSFAKIRVKPSPEAIKERRRLKWYLQLSLGITPVLLLISYLLDIPFILYLGIVFLINMFAFNQKIRKEFYRREREKFDELQLQYEYLESVFSKTAQTAGVNTNLFQIQQSLRHYKELEAELEQPGKSYSEETPVKDLVKERMQRVEQKVTEMLVALRSASVEVRRQQQKMVAQGKNSLKEFLQTKANVDHLSFNFNPGKIPYEYLPQAILISSLFIYLFLPSFSAPSQKPDRATVKIVSADPPPAVRDESAAPRVSMNVPPESITDREIASYSENTRKEFAAELIKRAKSSSYAGNFAATEASLKFALRFDKNSVEAINLLGINSYDLKKFKEALDYFNSAKKLNPEKAEEFYTGMTYLELERYQEAKTVFTKLTSQNATTQGLYNLGTAQMGLKNYKAAIENYKAILKITPNDTDALYQLGICYGKIRDAKKVLQTYETLNIYDPDRALEMRNIAEKSVKLDGVKADPPDVGVGMGVGTGVGNGMGNSNDDTPPPPPIRR